MQTFSGKQTLITVEPGYSEIEGTAKNCSLYPDFVIADMSKVNTILEVQYSIIL